MSGPSWLVDPSRIASKIRSASGAFDPGKANWKSNPTKSCPNCQHVIDNADVAHAWPGLPRGVKFDPSDQEIIWHLLTKVGLENLKPHPFIDEFIPTVKEDDGICYTHPQNLPGVRQDGSVSHFFHRAIKAYSTGNRKRRKIHGDDLGDVRWHKTGRTKPVSLDGEQKGCKKIMVLYVSSARGGKAEKTNWVMHQYHLGTGEDEKEGQYVVSKVFYQQQSQQTRQIDRIEDDVIIEEGVVGLGVMIPKVDPVTPKLVTPEPRAENMCSDFEPVQDSALTTESTVEQHDVSLLMRDEIETPSEQSDDQHPNNIESDGNQTGDKNDDLADDNTKWWENESQYMLNSQQMMEGISICKEFLQSQSPNRDGNVNSQDPNISKPLLPDYTRLGAEDFKQDLAACHLPSDLANIELDTPPDIRLSQLEFESEDSYIAWGGSVQGGKTLD